MKKMTVRICKSHKLISGQFVVFKTLIYNLIRKYVLGLHMSPCGIFSKVWT